MPFLFAQHGELKKPLRDFSEGLRCLLVVRVGLEPTT